MPGAHSSHNWKYPPLSNISHFSHILISLSYPWQPSFCSLFLWFSFLEKKFNIILILYLHTGLPWWLRGKKNLLAMQEPQETWVRSLGWEGNNPLPCSCLENPLDQGAWQATVHGVAKIWTRQSNQHFHTLFTALGQGVVGWGIKTEVT